VADIVIFRIHRSLFFRGLGAVTEDLPAARPLDRGTRPWCWGPRPGSRRRRGRPASGPTAPRVLLRLRPGPHRRGRPRGLLPRRCSRSPTPRAVAEHDAHCPCARLPRRCGPRDEAEPPGDAVLAGAAYAGVLALAAAGGDAVGRAGF